jgi:hypothetical protein
MIVLDIRDQLGPEKHYDPTKRSGENSGFREGQTVSRSYKVPIGLLIV